MKFSNIVVEPPGPKAQELLERDRRVLTGSFVRFYPMVVDSATDFLVKDVDGNTYIDLNSGLVVLNVGSRNPYVIEGVKRQLDKFTHYSYTDFYYESIVTLGEKLIEISPGTFEKRVFYGNSGTEAVEATLKAIRYYSKRPRFIAFSGAFHGRTFGSLSLTSSKPVQMRGFFPLVPGVTHIPYAYCYRCPFKLEYPECGILCANFLEEEVLSKYVPPDEVGGIIIEPIQGEGGYIVPPKEFIQGLKRIAEKYGILFAVDEIQSGVGRTGKWFAIEHFDVVPDLIALAKSIGGGFPLGVMIGRADVMIWPPGSHASTFGGNPVSAEAALGVIRYIEDHKLLEKAARDGEYVIERFNEIKERCELIGDVRGKGLMIGIEIVKDRKTKAYGAEEAMEIMLRSWKNGVLLITCGKSTLRFAPPLTIPREAIDEAIDIVEKQILSVAKL